MRPKTIVYFERIMFGALLLGVLQGYLNWDRAIAVLTPTAGRDSAVAFTLTIVIFSFVILGTLTLLVSRRRSKIAMWVLIALFVIGLPSVFTSNIIAVLRTSGQLVAYGLLFTPSARRWMSRKDEKDEKLREVFH